ncbi:MAG: hypothetical protein Q9219_000388 [cf. Caloplaca sp. 3 TL-2023]
MASAALVGSTGLVGSHILRSLQSKKLTIHAIARKEIPSLPLNVNLILQSDSSQWPSILKSLDQTPDILLSALGTTRAQAGSFAAQRTIDYDLNLALAKTAKESGVSTYVLISSAGVSSKSVFPYSKLKGELEDAIKELDFPYTVIVKPKLLLGDRQDSRGLEAAAQGIAKALGIINESWLRDTWAIDADLVGRAAVAAALECTEGKREKGIWVLQQSDIFRLGKQTPS